MKKIVYLLIIFFTLFSCSKSDDEKNENSVKNENDDKNRNIVITDFGIEYNVIYKLQYKDVNGDYVYYPIGDLSISFLNSTDIKENNMYGTVINKYSLEEKKLSDYSDKINISCPINFIENPANSKKTVVTSPILGSRIYRNKGNLYLDKSQTKVNQYTTEVFKFIKQ